MVRFFFGLVALFVLADTSAAQNSLNSDDLAGFRPVWSYRDGDDSLWAHPEYPELGWEPLVETEFTAAKMPDRGWTGIGWFRTTIDVDDRLAGAPLAFALKVRGAADLFIDGALVQSYGRVGQTVHDEVAVSNMGGGLKPGSYVFARGGKHTIAVRVSNYRLADYHKVGGPLGGFSLTFDSIESTTRRISGYVRKTTANQFLFSGIQYAFALLFFLLWAFYRVRSAHLWFAMLCLFGGTVVFLDLELLSTYDGDDLIALRRVMHLLVVLTLTAGLKTTYLLLNRVSPNHFYAILAASVGIAVWNWIDPYSGFTALNILNLIILIEMSRVVVISMFGPERGVSIILIGLLAVVAGIVYDSLLDLNIIMPVGGFEDGYYYGFTVLEISMAVFLATEFARTNRQLKGKLIEVEQLSERAIGQERLAAQREIERTKLEADNRRKALEIEKGRELKASYEALEESHETLKNTQRRLIHAEKMASLGKLTAGIAHEIKNPLNFVNNFATSSADMAHELKEILDSGQSGRENDVNDIVVNLISNAERIAQHGARADGIVKSMMQHAKGTTGTRQQTDINSLVDEYVRLSHRSIIARHGGVEIEIERDFDQNVGNHVVVPQSLGRALTSVLDNAFESVLTPHQPHDEPARVFVSTSRLNDAILIRITDNGPGVSPENRDRIFEPFFTTKPAGEGTGLGLSLAHDIIVDGLGGTIGIEHLTTCGAGFYITIPAEPLNDDTLGAGWPETL